MFETIEILHMHLNFLSSDFEDEIEFCAADFEKLDTNKAKIEKESIKNVKEKLKQIEDITRVIMQQMQNAYLIASETKKEIRRCAKED